MYFLSFFLQVPLKMDVQSFLRVVQIDDVLLQVRPSLNGIDVLYTVHIDEYTDIIR